jgi:hypothetical protein
MYNPSIAEKVVHLYNSGIDKADKEALICSEALDKLNILLALRETSEKADGYLKYISLYSRLLFRDEAEKVKV